MTKIYNYSYHEKQQVRQAQLIVPFGIGALMDVQNQSIIIADSRYWSSQNEIFHDIRLEHAMHANGFIEPPQKNGNITAKLFPRWYFSPIADKHMRHMLKPLSEWRNILSNRHRQQDLKNFNERPFTYANSKKGIYYPVELVPARIICVCYSGHIQDFPWFEWAHSGNVDESVISKHQLSLVQSGSSGTISDLTVECSCGKKKNLSGIFSPDFSKKLASFGISCHGKYVWKKIEKNKECRQPLVAQLRNANDLYFPNVVSSVNIPLQENILIEKIKNNTYFPALQKAIDNHDMILQEKLISAIAKEVDLSEKVVQAAIDKDNKQKNSLNEITEREYRSDEYEVLTGNLDYQKRTARFKAKFFNQKDYLKEPLSEYIDKITLVSQLEVVRVLKSFSRIRPIESDQIEELGFEDKNLSEDDYMIPKEVSLRRRNDNSYVGLRARGEGIFISLNSDLITSWQAKINKDSFANRILDKRKDIHLSEKSKTYLDPTYYLIHTLAHLLIRELSFSSGYAASSLAERIYWDNSRKMYGLLIYTSSSDSDGTLGGLVRQGLPSHFFKILNAALEKARWCSYDPTCIDNEGQGHSSLNLAACYACALVSETSCEHSNLFLDRGVLIGTLKSPQDGFFKIK